MKLFDHQVSGAKFLAGRGKALLGDTPGLGKTATAIEALRLKGVYRPLVICPAIARSHWANEFAKMEWSGEQPHIESFEEITMGGLAHMANHIYGREPIDGLVIDEFMKVKHPTSLRAQLIAGNDGYARRLEHVIALSGSIPRHAGELYTTLVSLAPHLLSGAGIKTREQFMSRYTERRFFRANGQMREKVVGQKNVGELQHLLDVVMIKRDLPDVGLDVPKVWWQQMRVDADGFPMIDEMGRVETNAAVTAALREGTLADIAEDPYIARMRRRIGELKAPAVVEALRDQLEGTGEQIVVFAHHRSVLEILKEGLYEHGLGISYIDGDTSRDDRDAEVKAFQAGKRRVFIGQNIACQYSLTLTAAHRVVLVEPDWTADVNYQLGQRIARIGSTAERCIGQLVVLAGTLDEAIVRQNERELRQYAELFTRATEMV
jgi:SWI/SNF-related matrix-associated actin-dependent regulator 1 of chromatin subfamily A